LNKVKVEESKSLKVLEVVVGGGRRKSWPGR
jgi:hypothetical protein